MKKSTVFFRAKSRRAFYYVSFLVLSICLVLCSACTSPKEKAAQKATKAAIDEALKSLRKVVSATEVGVTYTQYGALLIEAKASVNEAMLLIKNDELKIKLANIMQYFEDASTLWRWKVYVGSDYLDQGKSVWPIIAKYGLATYIITVTNALSQLWQYASREVALTQLICNRTGGC